MDEKLKGSDYIHHSYLELVSHPDFNLGVWYSIHRLLDMTTEQIETCNLRGLD